MLSSDYWIDKNIHCLWKCWNTHILKLYTTLVLCSLQISSIYSRNFRKCENDSNCNLFYISLNSNMCYRMLYWFIKNFVWCNKNLIWINICLLLYVLSKYGKIKYLKRKLDSLNFFLFFLGQTTFFAQNSVYWTCFVSIIIVFLLLGLPNCRIFSFVLSTFLGVTAVIFGIQLYRQSSMLLIPLAHFRRMINPKYSYANGIWIPDFFGKCI